MKLILLTWIAFLSAACNSQGRKAESTEVKIPRAAETGSQIGDYVVETFEDSKGMLWFGTLEKGVAKYDGNKLTYITTADGLPSNRVTNIIEDKAGNLWFGTGAGISKFDGKSFVNYSEKDGLCSDMISYLLIDNHETLWIGTWGGVCKFDGTKFENFPLSYPIIDTRINPDTKDWITSIEEDAKGNIWLGRDGYGASKFDGNSIVHYTTKDGLNSNNVQAIVEDNEGNIWMGTRVAEKDNVDTSKRTGNAGLNKFNGDKFVHFPEIAGLSESDVFAIFKDRSGDLWISSTSYGVYKLANNEFVNYKVPTSTMCFLKDKKDNIWLGCAGGLYKIGEDGKAINVTTNGPWQ